MGHRTISPPQLQKSLTLDPLLFTNAKSVAIQVAKHWIPSIGFVLALLSKLAGRF